MIFEWDERKASANAREHGVTFEHSSDSEFAENLVVGNRRAGLKAYLTERAAQKGIPLGEMVNTLLKQEIQIVESAT